MNHATDNDCGAGSPLQLGLASGRMPRPHACSAPLVAVPCENVGHVVVGVELAHLDMVVRDVPSYLQVAPINMPCSLAGAPLFGQLDGA
eukprot:1616191-Pleurochrysis_carterae.AAC.2